MAANDQVTVVELLKSADAALEVLHVTPERVRPLKFTEVRQAADLLTRIKRRVEDLRADFHQEDL